MLEEALCIQGTKQKTGGWGDKDFEVYALNVT